MVRAQIFDQVAQVFNITEWPVAAVKAYVGHSLSAASGEQLIASLGIFKYGIVPGIKTIDKVADDVFADRLAISTVDVQRQEPVDVAFLNSKGFGGNNATASVFAPHVVDSMLAKRYGVDAFAQYQARRTQVHEAAQAYDAAALKGDFSTIYHFGEGLIDESLIAVDQNHVSLPGFAQAIDLNFTNRFADMFDAN